MLDTLVVTAPISDTKLRELKKAFKVVHNYPGGENVPAEVIEEAQIWYTTWMGLPKSVKTIEEVPNTKAIQLSSGKIPNLDVGKGLADLGSWSK